MIRTVPDFKPTVLVVEDETLTRMSTIAMVEEAGFEAVGVSNADEALSVLETRDDIRAVFTDVQMPGSMDGLGLIRLVRDRWPAVAGLVSSGKSSITETDLPSGVRFFAKPYLPFQIEAALRQLIP
jgi:CheY-like chemotaxis protein